MKYKNIIEYKKYNDIKYNIKYKNCTLITNDGDYQVPGQFVVANHISPTDRVLEGFKKVRGVFVSELSIQGEKLLSKSLSNYLKITQGARERSFLPSPFLLRLLRLVSSRRASVVGRLPDFYVRARRHLFPA